LAIFSCCCICALPMTCTAWSPSRRFLSLASICSPDSFSALPSLSGAYAFCVCACSLALSVLSELCSAEQPVTASMKAIGKAHRVKRLVISVFLLFSPGLTLGGWRRSPIELAQESLHSHGC